MEEMKERNFVCKYCDKQFPSGKSLGGHIRIHTNENSVDSDRFNGTMNKKLVDHQRETLALKQQQQQQFCCTECGREFVTLKAYRIHMTCHSKKEKMLMDSQSDTETYSAPTRKRSKRVLMKQSSSESFSNGNSSVTTSEINQEVINGALNLMRFSRDTSFKIGHKLVMNSLGELSDKNSVILETKSSSGEVLKIPNVKNEVLETDKVAVVDELRSADDNDVILYDSDGSDVDYFMNGPKKSDSVNRSLRNNGFASQFNKRFRSSDEKGSKYELSRSKRVPSYETDSCADTKNEGHRFSDIKTAMVKKAGDEKKKSKGHKCPICFRVFKSGQALGGHKRSHNQEQNQIAEMRNQIDLNLPALDTDD